MNFKLYLSIIGFILANSFCFSSDYAQINIGTKGELKDNYVHSIYKDSDGFIWVGTGTTVERWDGVQGVVYPFPEYNLEYAPYLVNTILERKPHDYWVGCKKGLWKVNLKNCKMERAFSEQIAFPVYALAKDEVGRLYMGTENGLYLYDGKGISNIRVDTEGAQSGSNRVLGIEIVGKNTAWLMTPEGLVLCTPQSKTIKFYPNTLSGSGNLLSIARVGETFYIGTEKKGILTFDCSNHRYSSYWDKIQAPVSALSYENGFLAVATLGQGIHLLSLSDKRLVYEGVYNPKVNNGLVSNRFSSILLSQGNIWGGTDNYSGMVNLKEQSTIFDLYATKGFNSAGIPIRSVFQSDDQLFVSNRDGFVCIKNDDVRYFNAKTVGKEKLRSDLVFSFYKYEGILLIGTYAGGVCAMIPETYAFIETPLTKALTKNDIFMFLEDAANNLWIAASDGLYCYDKRTQTIKEYNAFNSGMPGNIVYGIYIDSSDRFWVATNRGVAQFDPKTGKCSQKMLPEGSLIRNEPVRSVYEGRDGTLFFCILNNNKEKTFCISDKHLKNFRFPLSIECYNIIQDQDGSYWLGSYLGVVKMNEELTRFTLFTSADGLPDAPMTGGPAIVKDPYGRFWMANMKGLVTIDPAMATDVHPSPVRITEVGVNGVQVLDDLLQSGSSFSLKRSENNLVFRFVSLGYENPEEMKYEFMLKGRDSTWMRLDHDNKVAYYNLKPGTYTFKVRKLLNEESATEISFKIENDFPWILFGVVLLLLSGITLAILYVRKKRKGFSEKESEEIYAGLKATKEERTAASSESYVKLTEDEVERMINELKAYMEKDKPYLNVDLKQSDVAMALGYSTYLLSALFTYYLKTGYYDFVNTYRIEEFKCRVKAGEHKKYTLLTLAEQCGFKSKTSFFRSFKKITGLTPKEYIQRDK